MDHEELRGLLSDEHFSIWAPSTELQGEGRIERSPSGDHNGERDFHGETRSNDPHPQPPQALLYREGKRKKAKLSYVGNALTENRHGLVIEAELGTATGTIEREAAMTMVARHSPGSRRLTLGADKAYDVHKFVDDLRDFDVTPHIARNTTNRSSAIDVRTTRHPATRSVSRSAIEPRNRSAGVRPTRPADAARRRALTVQIHSDHGSLRPHLAAATAGGVRMTSGKINRPGQSRRLSLGSISCRRTAQTQMSGC
jgi:hypothetical protein